LSTVTSRSGSPRHRDQVGALARFQAADFVAQAQQFGGIGRRAWIAVAGVMPCATHQLELVGVAAMQG
jgi:hypothetical protein